MMKSLLLQFQYFFVFDVYLSLQLHCYSRCEGAESKVELRFDQSNLIYNQVILLMNVLKPVIKKKGLPGHRLFLKNITYICPLGIFQSNVDINK